MSMQSSCRIISGWSSLRSYATLSDGRGSRALRDDVAPTLDALGMSLRGVETLELFGCRSFNGINGAKLGEHGHANALDVRSLRIADGTVIELTNATVSKSLREQLRIRRALRTGTETSDLTRQSVLQVPEEGTMRPPSSGTHPQEQTVTVGPWTISTSYKADDFDGCAMCRSTEGMDVTFLRTRDSLLLFLQSQRWNLERGKAYTVRLMAGSRSVEAKALAESKAVMIALADRSFNERLSTVDLLEVRGERATLRVPLEGSAAALKRLDACLDWNNGAGIDFNPFVSPSNRPRHHVLRARDRRRWGVSLFR